MFDVQKQIEDILSNSVVQKHYFKNQNNDDIYKEITSGKMYKNLAKNSHDITLSFNTDGVSLFKSSGKSIWHS